MKIQIIDDPGTTESILGSEMGHRERMATHRAIYAYTTENLKATLDALVEHYPDQVKGDVFTIGGSGDHLLNFAHAGATNITALDFSLAALYYADLKWVARFELDYEIFLKFFELGVVANKPQLTEWSFSEEIYEKLKPKLMPESREFWDRVIKDRTLLRRHFMMGFYENNEVAKKANNYLQDQPHYDQKRGKGISPVLISQSIKDYRPGRFDVAHLSNIEAYFPDNTHGRSDFSSIIHVFREQLNPGGILVRYSPYDQENSTDRHMKFLGFEVQKILLPNIFRYGTHDHMIVVSQKT